MDAIVYEMAFRQFSRVMPLREAPPFAAAAVAVAVKGSAKAGRARGT